MNNLSFATGGYDGDHVWIGIPTMAYYDKDQDGVADPHKGHASHPSERVLRYRIKLNSGLAVILTTLTWNTPGTDIDLHVTDPLGETSYFGNHTTSSGGSLDYDVQNGFGPEHFTLLDTNTIQWGQPYLVKVNYWSDHLRTGDDPPQVTNYTVTVDLYEGTPRATSVTYTGTLTATGETQDVCTVTPEEPPAVP
jgi:uncharacterized protein YfaP (DUF2135 family)